jgi:predicted alpha/beta-fold hydrolase
MMLTMPVEPDTFVPAWWCRGPHAQTIWGSLLPAPAPARPVIRQRWDTPDGDFLDVDLVRGGAGAPVLIALHGLEGSTGSGRIRGLLAAAARRGWHGLAVNFRGCSGEANRLPRSYHGGETGDLAWVVDRVAADARHGAIAVVGMSLGANVLLKYLGERAGRLPGRLAAAAAISAPFDLAASARAFERGAVNRLYMARLLRSLTRKTRRKLRAFPALADPARLAAVRTIAEFDDLVTAPAHGFADAAAYWTASSCAQFLDAITVPTLVISALDDPVIPAASVPRERLAAQPRLTAILTAAGGHVGFVRGSPLRPACWAEERVLEFVHAHTERAG